MKIDGLLSTVEGKKEARKRRTRAGKTSQWRLYGSEFEKKIETNFKFTNCNISSKLRTAALGLNIFMEPERNVFYGLYCEWNIFNRSPVTDSGDSRRII